MKNLVLDVSDLDSTELRLLANFLAVRAGVCAEAEQFNAELDLRGAAEWLRDEIARRNWVSKAAAELAKHGACAEVAARGAEDLARNYYPDTDPVEAVHDFS